ncbi:ArnT family glycosyltransferase [Sphingomonas arenae]|uniref:ArnT family glycosyltransferase n=1 Tax=Sphingomonas arenae TaxID=2812555 RepID=UPI001966FA0D|nr:glycosyltransferase family 39 protein [Sphingomonas arenae]
MALPPLEQSGRSQGRVVLVLLMLASAVVFLLNTRHGIGILPDSVAYMHIGSASHFAPGYTWLLQAFEPLNHDIVGNAKYVGLVLVIINTWLFWRLLYRFCGSTPLAVAGTALIAFSPVYITMHRVAMSEPLLLFGIAASALLFVHGLERRRPVWFVPAGVLMGLAILTRFAAAPMLAALCGVRLALRDVPLRSRLVQCALLAGPAVVVCAIWLMANHLSASASTGRELSFNGNPSLALWNSGLQSLSIMLLPAPIPSAVRVPFFLLNLAATLWLGAAYARRWLGDADGLQRSGWAALPIVFGLFALFYALFLVASVLIQASLPLNGRILLPLYVALVLVAVMAASALSRAGVLPRHLRTGLLILGAIILVSHAVRTAATTREAFQSGVGYADIAWSRSPVLREVERLPTDARLYSNAPDVISFRLNRPAEYLPRKVNHLTLKEDPRNPFSAQMRRLRDDLESGRAYVVVIDRVDWRFYIVPEAELLRDVPLQRIANVSDGRVYQFASASRAEAR